MKYGVFGEKNSSSGKLIHQRRALLLERAASRARSSVVEQMPYMHPVEGSIPSAPINLFDFRDGRAALLEHYEQLAKPHRI